MHYYLNKMASFEDVLFWILILATIAVLLWKLIGSPTDLATLITVGTFLITSEVLIWKKLFSVENNFNSKLSKLDKNTSIGFMKVKHDIDKFRIEVDHRFNKVDQKFNKIDNRLSNIENKLNNIVRK